MESAREHASEHAAFRRETDRDKAAYVWRQVARSDVPDLCRRNYHHRLSGHRGRSQGLHGDDSKVNPMSDVNKAAVAATLDGQFLLLSQDFAQFKTATQKENSEIKADIQGLRNDIRLWMSSRQGSVWKILGLIGAVLIPAGFFLSLYVSSITRPISDRANDAKLVADSAIAVTTRNTENLTKVNAENATSIQDRGDKQKAIDGLVITTTNLLSKVDSMNAAMNTSLAEVETQIDGTAQMLNIQWATQQRKDSDFQNALHDMGAKIPTSPNGPWFFPNISSRKPLDQLSGKH